MCKSAVTPFPRQCGSKRSRREQHINNASEMSVLILTKSDSAVLWIAFICWIIDVVETAYREELGGGKSPTW